ncbi:MAG: hypothetical protein ACFFDN_26895 [Candidatus Hodarchaeota archaeon]
MMHAFKFETTVLDDGIIKIPEIRHLVNKKVEIFIVEKENQQAKSNRPKISFEEFSNKWAGFLKGADITNWKEDYVNYLEEKYK